MPARWQCGVFVLGLLFVAASSDKCPYQPGPAHQTAGYVPKPIHPAKSDYNTGGHKPQYPGSHQSFCPKVGGLESHCRPAKDCAVWYDLVRKTPWTACTLHNGYDRGLCCPDLPINVYSRAPFKKPSPCEDVKFDDHVDKIDLDAVHAAVHHAGKNQMASLVEAENGLARQNILVRPGSARYTHSCVYFQTADEALKNAGNTLHGVFSGHNLVHGHQIKPHQAHCALNQFYVKDTGVTHTCPTFPVCDKKELASPYRTITGICNHVHSPGNIPCGVSDTQYQRILTPDYADGYWMPRRAVDGGELPSPRVVFLTVVRDVEARSETDIIFVMQFGQVIDHDLQETLESKLADGSPVPCCTEDEQFLSEQDYAHGKCFPIVIPKDDPFYFKLNRHCMEFARSAPTCRNQICGHRNNRP
ncbi:hypothetical protein DAPPUDRAFT_326243 [Daphnia pulex]|uniref:Clip domain-containing protein n=1 Tax=Daphnia pulex TaxID=6669 RepID=E9H766_DAPPU|nr:hypothetical protein DAPPUDRAFT_326243 [Daphnia pulex]|eukprot:EFX72420.1 hypothetical protein DAPPUDRAFT_326243 [Daphnia pulex]